MSSSTHKNAAAFTKATTTTKSHALHGTVSEQIEKLSVGRELLDTTWRMTVPVIMFAGVGIAIDIALGSKPWVTMLGTVVGFYFAILLVKRQIARGDNSDGTVNIAAQKRCDDDAENEEQLEKDGVKK